MSEEDKHFIKRYEELLDKGYCDCNEMNCIDNNSPRRILNIVKDLQEQLQQKENIIKEVREYLKFLKEHYEELRTNPVEDSYFINDMLRQMFIQSIENYLLGIEDILDKENI